MELLMLREYFFRYGDMIISPVPPPQRFDARKIVVLNREDCHRADANIRKDRVS